jgi:hypothetical protein
MRPGHLALGCRSEGKAGTRESKAPGGRGAAGDRVAYDRVSLRAGHRIVGAVAHGMRTTCNGARVYVSEDPQRRCVVHRSANRVVAAFPAMLPIRLMAVTSWYAGSPSDDYRPLRVAPHRP